MTRRKLEERIASLEDTVAQLVAVVRPAKQNGDWRSTVGMFEDDPVIREIQEEGRRLREADRRETQWDTPP
ncbi:MAG: hypothetical protein NTW96_25800 [Planctomycetia bacterium]|nr:hypothetical protein [Planctomycetia bacterium]